MTLVHIPRDARARRDRPRSSAVASRTRIGSAMRRIERNSREIVARTAAAANTRLIARSVTRGSKTTGAGNPPRAAHGDRPIDTSTSRSGYPAQAVGHPRIPVAHEHERSTRADRHCRPITTRGPGSDERTRARMCRGPRSTLSQITKPRGSNPRCTYARRAPRADTDSRGTRTSRRSAPTMRRAPSPAPRSTVPAQNGRSRCP